MITASETHIIGRQIVVIFCMPMVEYQQTSKFAEAKACFGLKEYRTNLMSFCFPNDEKHGATSGMSGCTRLRVGTNNGDKTTCTHATRGET